jgi:hypothetical protein
MGLEHILTGYDHLLFLLGLVLVGRPLSLTHRRRYGVHTLADSVRSPSPPSRPCPFSADHRASIALSIAYVGIENWFVEDARGRWRITFLFGLVHGLGSPEPCAKCRTPRRHPATLAFNLGVELGQLAVLARRPTRSRGSQTESGRGRHARLHHDHRAGGSRVVRESRLQVGV